MTLRRAVTARLLRLWRDLRAAASLRRTERSVTTYALRVICMALILVVLPLQKLIQLGLIGFILAALKVAVGLAIVAAALALVFAAQEIARRRRKGRGEAPA
jgi:mannose/fructose/N-acetylgalactosamine-specific phosphotransferase system component IIC